MKTIIILLFFCISCIITRIRHRRYAAKQCMECFSVSDIPKIEEFESYDEIKIHISTSVDFTKRVEQQQPRLKKEDMVIPTWGYFPFKSAPYRGDPIYCDIDASVESQMLRPS